MAKTYRLTPMRRLVGRIAERSIRRDKGMPGWHMLTSTGRKTNLPRRIPVTLVEHHGTRYLVAGYGIVGWVHNVRANPGVTVERAGTVDSVVATEVAADEAGPVLEQYYALLKRFVAPYWDVPSDGATPADFVAAATAHPTFRLDSAD